MGGCLAGEVASIELREGGVDVGRIEENARRNPVVGVDVNDVQQLAAECLRRAGRDSGA